MTKIMLVDDEVLALEYLKNIVDWEGHGYHIVGTAVNGRLAMELYRRTLPEIVITDIKMAGMDGLELAGQLKAQNPDVIVIFLSAYRDFEYAQQGIRYGVSNYLLKHELSQETLLDELQKIEKRLELVKKRRKVDQEHLMNQLIYNRQTENQAFMEQTGENFLLFMIHKESRFISGEFIRAEWETAETGRMEEALPRIDVDGISYVAGVPLAPDNWIALCQIARISSMQVSDDRIRQWAKKVIGLLEGVCDSVFHVICSRKMEMEHISQAFRMMSLQIQQAIFWRPNTVRFLQTVPDEEKVLWGEQMRKLGDAVYDEAGEPGKMARQLLETLREEERPQAYRSLLSQMNDLLQEISGKAGIAAESSTCSSMDEVMLYYERRFDALHRQLCNRKMKKYSRVVVEAIAYIRKNYQKELSLEILGTKFHMNGVYLGQLFKKEVGVSILKYQTLLRIEAAKRLLREENRTVAETAQLVGYQTSGYFSQLFGRNTGKTPQEYRNKG